MGPPEVGYLFGGKYTRTVSDPAVDFGEFGLGFDPKLMIDGLARGGLPPKLIF